MIGGELLVGALDLHLHTAPDLVKRRYSDLEAARRAEAVGMAGIVLKCHHESTVGRAAGVSEATGFTVHGGIVLNPQSSGTPRVEAVRTALGLGARMVWWPTLSAAAHQSYYHGIPTPEPPVDRDELDQLCRLVRQQGAVLATGHAGSATVWELAEASTRTGAKLLVTHADFWIPDLSIQQQAALAAAHPDLVFERCAYVCAQNTPDPRPIDHIVDGIRATGGSARNVVSSDLGQPELPDYPEGLASFAVMLIEAGLSEDAIRSMLSDRPQALLDREPPTDTAAR
jgi:hypothetical protein